MKIRKNDTTTDILDIPVHRLKIRRGIVYHLKDHNICTIGDLIKFTENDLTNIMSLSNRSLQQIYDELY